MGEIVKLCWSEVDFERRCLRLADSKTGRKTIYLNTAALQVLAELDHDPENPHVIRGAITGGHLIGLTRIWYRIRRRAGLEDVRLHDLRHTYASIGAGMGLSLPIIGKLLGHTQAVTTQRYAHLAASPMHEAAERIGATIAASLAGRQEAEILPIDANRRTAIAHLRSLWAEGIPWIKAANTKVVELVADVKAHGWRLPCRRSG